MGQFDIIAVTQVTERCNLQCAYCFVPELTARQMSDATLDRFIQQMLEYNERKATFIWHGGEPLLRGQRFYERVLDLQQQHNRKPVAIINKVQTNGTVFTDSLVDFLQRHDFHIGVSGDGPAAIHDQTRVFKNGRGSYALMKAGLAKLNSSHGKILVLTKPMIDHEQEIYEELKSSGNGARINLYIPTGYGAGKRDELMMTPKEAGRSLIALYELWKQDPGKFDLKPFSEVIQGFVTGEMETCEYSPEACKRIVGVSYDGKVYRCSRGIPDIRNLLGDLTKESLEVIASRISPVPTSERQRILRSGECGSCSFFDLCGGGCPQESLAVCGNFLHKTYYCESRKMLFSHIFEEDLKHVPDLAVSPRPARKPVLVD